MDITNITLQDLLHAINILGEDRDVCVDGIGAIAVCPPVMLTPKGREHFKDALSANVIVEYTREQHQDTYVSNDGEADDEKAWELLKSLAGYCNANNFEQWFEGENTKML